MTDKEKLDKLVKALKDDYSIDVTYTENEISFLSGNCGMTQPFASDAEKIAYLQGITDAIDAMMAEFI